MRSLVKKRLKAFQHQAGLCYYCSKPTWINEKKEFAKEQHLTLKESSRYQCTAEHLVARSEGGSNSEGNIVAACFFCNQVRHRRKRPKNPDDFKKYVSMRLAKGKWHPKKNASGVSNVLL